MGKIKVLMETLLGKANGVATLDGAGNVPNTQLGNAVNKAGDTMTGPLYIGMDGGVAGISANVYGTYIFSNEGDFNKGRYLYLGTIAGRPTDKDSLIINMKTDDGYGADYVVLHTGNKPSGSYTGNGDATPRTIETGGIGNFCILKVHGYGISIVTMQGAYKMGSTYNGWTDGTIFRNGVLTLTTTDPYLNPSGVSVEYQVL